MRTFRVGGTMRALLGWNAIAILAAFGAVYAASETRNADDQSTLIAVAAMLALAGPVAFVFYLARYALVRVDLGRDGLVVARRREIPWAAIRSVRQAGWKLGGWNPLANLRMSGCSWVVVVLLFQAVMAILAVVAVIWIVRVVVLPVLVLYSPFHPRVVIDLADGKRIVYRDLEDPEVFVDVVRARIGEA